MTFTTWASKIDRRTLIRLRYYVAAVLFFTIAVIALPSYLLVVDVLDGSFPMGAGHDYSLSAAYPIGPSAQPS